MPLSLPVPVSSSTVTTYVTTAPITTRSVTPVLAHSVLGKPYSAGEAGFRRALHLPTLSINPELRGQLPAEWEYFSTERIPKIRATVPEMTIIAQTSLKTPVAKSVEAPSHLSRKWYTPVHSQSSSTRRAEKSHGAMLAQDVQTPTGESARKFREELERALNN